MLESSIPESAGFNQQVNSAKNGKFDDTVSTFVENATILADPTATGSERPWRDHKLNSWSLAQSYQRLGFGGKAGRIRDCGGFLQFSECPNGHHKTLKTANFCKVRLCPMCSWRRSLVIFAQLNKILHVAAAQRKMQYLFLTLTMRNVKPDELSGAISQLFHAWDKLMKRTEVKNITIGWFRGLEVTHNLKEDTYHPHFHVMLCVPHSYFDSTKYIRQERWAELWKESLSVDYTPIVDVRKVKAKREGQTVEGAVAEAGKYAVKPEDYILDDPKAMDDAVLVLETALANRRLIAFGGLLKKIRKELKMQDAEQADLIHVDEDEPEKCTCPVCNSDLQDHLYRWNFGLKNYIG